MRLYVTGDRQVLGRIQVARRGMPNEVARALGIELETVELPEVYRRTPLDKGPLRESLRVDGPHIIPGRQIQGGIAAGGPTAPYAIYVHEDLEADHPIGEAKFIESTLRESSPHLGRRVGRRMSLANLR